jgi:hypothetical protein
MSMPATRDEPDVQADPDPHGGLRPRHHGLLQSLKFIGDRLEKQFGDRIDVKYVWNIMDFGYRAEDILWLVESGVLTLGYQSSSYLTDRVPELSFVDLPFLFAQRDVARAGVDGRLGIFLAGKIEESVNYRILGWYENGFRHISNRLRTIRSPADMKGMRIRVLPSEVQARTFALLGAVPQRLDLTEAIAAIKAGTIDGRKIRSPTQSPISAQVSQLPHRDQPLLYLAADLPASHRIRRLAAGTCRTRCATRSRPRSRSSASSRSRRTRRHAKRSPDQGCESHRADRRRAAQFKRAVEPLWADARKQFGREIFELMPGDRRRSARYASVAAAACASGTTS